MPVIKNVSGEFVLPKPQEREQASQPQNLNNCTWRLSLTPRPRYTPVMEMLANQAENNAVFPNTEGFKSPKSLLAQHEHTAQEVH